MCAPFLLTAALLASSAAAADADDANRAPKVQVFNHDIHDDPIKSHIILFVDRRKDYWPGLEKNFTEVAREYDDRLLFVVVPSDDKEIDNMGVRQLFGIRRSKQPAVIIANAENINEKHLLKLKDGEDLNTDTMLTFADNFFDKKLDSFKVSAPAVDDSKMAVKVFVMDNFADRVQKPRDVHTLMAFTTKADTCTECVTMQKTLEKVADFYKDNPHVQIGTMDYIENDWSHSSVNPRAVPEAYFFPAGMAIYASKYPGSLQDEAQILQFLKEKTAPEIDVEIDDDEDDENGNKAKASAATGVGGKDEEDIDVDVDDEL